MLLELSFDLTFGGSLAGTTPVLSLQGLFLRWTGLVSSVLEPYDSLVIFSTPSEAKFKFLA